MYNGIMNEQAVGIQRLYLTLTFGNILASSLIWGINTIFLLDAGLSNFEAFAANAFFTAGMVLFEIPTGVVADMWGRRASFLLGTVTLSVATWLYYFLWQVHAPFWEWAVVSMVLGLGFTFFSGAVEAWLVDAMKSADFRGNLEDVFGKGQIVTGLGMLIGSVSGGILAQATNLGFPFIIRAIILAIMFVVAFIYMRDRGFTPQRTNHPIRAMNGILRSSIDSGLKHEKIKWLMFAAPFSAGIGIYAFYAAQPYLLAVYGDPHAYSIAGLAAALIAGAQIAGGYLSPKLRKLPYQPITLITVGVAASALSLVLLGLAGQFILALGAIALWGVIFASLMPIRQAYLNNLIAAKERATILSFDSLMGNVGSVVTQPGLGKAADLWGYGTSFIISGAVQALAVPLLARSRFAPKPKK